MARPRIKIDVEQLESLAERQWTITEVAAFFRVSRDTIERRYAANYADGKQRGFAKLRDLQWKRAEQGSDRMLIHLGEQYLGQTKQVGIEATVSGSFGILKQMVGGQIVAQEILTSEKPKSK